MASKVEKLIFALQAAYEGENEVKRMSSDLKSLGEIDAHKEIEKGWQETTKKFAEAKQEVRSLRQELKNSSDIKIAEQLERAGASLEKFQSQASKQSLALDAMSLKVAEARTKYAALQAEYEKNPTDKLAVRIDKAGSSLQKFTKQLELQEKRLAGTNSEIDTTRKKVDELAKAYEKSVDPKIARQYDAATRNLKQLGTALDQQKRKLDQSRNTLREQGRALSDLDGDYDQLNGKVQEHGKTLAAMRTLGVRAFSDIEQEINGLEKAYRDLEASGTRSKREMAVYHTKMKGQISGLRKETSVWSQQIEKVHHGWLGLAGLMAGGAGFAYMVKNVTENEKALTNYARTAGLSVGEFQAYAFAVKSVGFEQEKLADISKDVKDKIGDFIETGGGEFADFFENVADKVGLTAEELIRMSGPDALIAVKKAMDEAGVATANQVTYMEMLANDASLLIPLLEKEGAALKEKAAAGRELTKAISEMDRDAVKDVNKSITNMTTSIGTLTTEIVATLAPAIIFVTESITSLAILLAEMPDEIQYAFAGTASVVAGLTAWHLGLKIVFGALLKGIGSISTLVDWLGKLRVALGATALASAGWVAVAGLVLYDIIAIKKLYDQYRELKQIREEIRQQEEANARSAQKLADRYVEISRSTGVAISSMEDLDKAVEDGRIHFDEATATWVTGAGKMSGAVKKSAEAQKRVTGKALEEMKQQYEKYVDEVKRLQEEIVGRERSLYDELREMRRSGMKAGDAWKDQKKQAEEYQKVAEEAAEAGDFTKALEYADKAKELYRGLNTEVEENGKVIVSAQEGLDTAMEGVKASGELAIEILKKQQEATTEAMEVLTDKSGFENLGKSMEESKQKWLKNWQDMKAATLRELDDVEKRIEKVVQDRKTKVYVNVIEEKKSGGLAGVFKFATGGSPAQAFQRLASPFITRGSGVRDDVPALLTRNEFVQSAPAVRFWGFDFMDAVNKMQFSRVHSLLAKGFNLGGLVNFKPPSFPPVAQMLAAGGSVRPLEAGTNGITVEKLIVNYNGTGSRADIKRLAKDIMVELQRVNRRT